MKISNQEKQQEQKYLEETVSIIRKKISTLGQELYDREDKLQEFKELIWDSKHDMDPGEMRFMMAESDDEVRRMERKGKYFQTLFKIQEKPYFGKIIFEDMLNTEEIYIGITYVEEDFNYYVHDWRSPICSLFYDYEIGKASYQSPDGLIEGELKSKRQYTIQDGKIKNIFDNSINIVDDVLQEVLSEDSNDKMKNIVNTIQQEQNQVIRNTDDNTLIVQGIAGSGKTSVALHRIAFLLYKIKNLSSNNILIFSPNKVFSEYISNVLPELGEDNTLQTTFNLFMEQNLPEFKKVEEFTSFIERYYKNPTINKDLITYKQSDRVIADINNYVQDLTKSVLFINDLETRDLTYSKEELNYFLKERYNHMLLFDIVPTIATKICDNYYDGKRTNHKKIVSELYKCLNIKKDFKEIYKNFYNSKYFIESYGKELSQIEINSITNKKEITYEDACIMTYLKGLLEGFSYKGLIKQVVIDEAQDYNKLQYIIIKNIFRNAGFTILGDVNQTINPYYKYDSLEKLTQIFEEDNRYLELKKTYRSTAEIIEFTNKILGLNYVTAIRKSNNIPVIEKKEASIEEQIIDDIKMLNKTSKSIAIITKTDEEAIEIYNKLLPKLSSISLLDKTSDKFNRDLVVVPSYMAKGLEFDAVIVYTDKFNKYRESEKYLYYVACTRAQHHLIVYNQ